MKFLERKDIDPEKWNARIAADSIENIFCYTWYLDPVSENWGALVSDDDYTTILPIPYTSKLGIKQMYQAPFTREYDIFGTAFNWEEALVFLSKKFNHFSFRNSDSSVTDKASVRSNQYIELSGDYKSAYRSNAKRLIKKGKKLFSFETSNDPEVLIQLFKDTVAHKIDAIGDKELAGLTALMSDAINRNQGELINVYKDGDLVAAGFFLKDKKRITYLKGASKDQAKKEGAMYALMNHSFEKFDSAYTTFDFGGSDIEAVATFYKKFGAIDRNYYNYTINNLPLWFKTLKRLKG